MTVAAALQPYGAVPTKRHMLWYRRGKTAMLHFTVNTFTGREWGDGTEDPSIFNPDQLDCRQWIAALKQAGFGAAILTAKHHDGFCLWPSKYTEHSVKNSPYKQGNGDIVREFVDACHEFGVMPGLYLSPWDRNHKEWGIQAYSDYYANQLTELMTEYGPIYECWWDGAGSDKAVYEWDRWADIVRKNQPDCVIYGGMQSAPYADVRWVGNELGFAAEDCYATITSDMFQFGHHEIGMTGEVDGDRFAPAECDTSIRPGWFYHSEQDAAVKTPEELVHYWFMSAGRNAAVVLNLPPDSHGLICQRDVDHIRIWETYLQAIFEKNLLEGGTVTADAISEDYSARYLLRSDDAKFYVANCLHPTVTVAFPQKTTFNCIKLEEVIELGHRIRDFTVEYLNDGQWRPLVRYECIGFCRAVHFPQVQADAVRLRILDAKAVPALRYFGVYCAPDYTVAYRPEHRDPMILTDLPTCKVIRTSDGYDVEFGGIYPFNKVVFDAAGVPSFEILAFDGTAYFPICKGENGTNPEICTFALIEGSYKVKIVFHGEENPRERSVCVCCE